MRPSGIEARDYHQILLTLFASICHRRSCYGWHCGCSLFISAWGFIGQPRGESVRMTKTSSIRLELSFLSHPATVQYSNEKPLG